MASEHCRQDSHDPDGVRALSVLAKEGIRVNITLVFSSPQALIVAKAGAYFVSHFLDGSMTFRPTG